MSDLTYTPPGVYVDENSSPVPNIGAVVALPPSRVALVGPSIGYQSQTDTLLLATDPVALTQSGVDTDTVVVTSLDGIVYTVGDDYTVTETGDTPTETTTTITRETGGTITADSVVYVSYQFSDSSFFAPYYSTDWDEIQSRFGPAILPDGTIGSPLSLAAKIVMEAGARELICVPTSGSTPSVVSATQLATAMATLSARDDVGIVVPLPVGITGTDGSPGDTGTVCTDLRSHVVNATTDGNARIGFIGLEKTAVRSFDALAASIASKRVCLVYPNIMNWYNGYTNAMMEISGYYLAAANAGRMAAMPAQMPLTLKAMASFSSIPSRVFNAMTAAFKNELSGSGVCVTEQTADGRLVVRHGVSTDMTSVLTREVSIVRAQDTLLRIVNRALERSGLVGGVVTVDSPIHVRGIVEGALAQAVQLGIIIGYSNLNVKRASSDPTQLDVKFAYDPSFPCNKITVGFSINTVTGTVQGV